MLGTIFSYAMFSLDLYLAPFVRKEIRRFLDSPLHTGFVTSRFSHSADTCSSIAPQLFRSTSDRALHL